MNNKINKLHERALRLVYKDKSLTFKQLLEKDQSFSIHERNIQKIAIEMFKVKNNLTPKPFQDIFVMKERGSNDFVIPRINTVKMGEGSVRYRGPKTWEIVPGEIKQSKSLDIFKNRIKEWRPVDCTCSLCETYVEGLGHGFFKEGSFVPK